jgi:hypothetical protein
MSLCSKLRVLKVNVERKESKKVPGTFLEFHSAEVMLLNDDLSLECVGKLPISKALQGQVVVGDYTPAFGFVRSEFGDYRGDIVVRLSGLTPVTFSKASSPSPAPAAAAPVTSKAN